MSYRAHVWTDTDNQRSGIPAVFFEDGFGFERYVEWLVDTVPMYFIYRDSNFIDVAGQSFRDFINGRLHNLAGAQPTIGDFADHMTTSFTDVRLKRYLEMRGADAGSPEMMLAQSALWVGLLYDEAALSAAEELVRDLTWEDAVMLRAAVPRQGLQTVFRGRNLRELANAAVAIARDGLRARDRRDATDQDERVYLAPLEAIAAGGPTQAEEWLARYHGDWQGDVRHIFAEAAI
jgi:glutamate--cysteine ligase